MAYIFATPCTFKCFKCYVPDGIVTFSLLTGKSFKSVWV